MPNDCYNYLEAPDGDLSLIADYISTAKRDWSPLPDTFLDFEKIVPMPPDVEDWYGWRNEHWGTRSNSYEGQAQDEGISFNTAWSPPVEAIVALAKRIGKPLRLIYDEPGMDFCGELIVDAEGKHCDEVYSPRKDAPEHLKEDLAIDEDDGFFL
jgi:hypothetical protein